MFDRSFHPENRFQEVAQFHILRLFLFLYARNPRPIMIQESNTITGSDDEQVAKVIEELQLLDQLDKLINASEVSHEIYPFQCETALF